MRAARRLHACKLQTSRVNCWHYTNNVHAQRREYACKNRPGDAATCILPFVASRLHETHHANHAPANNGQYSTQLCATNTLAHIHAKLAHPPMAPRARQNRCTRLQTHPAMRCIWKTMLPKKTTTQIKGKNHPQTSCAKRISRSCAKPMHLASSSMFVNRNSTIENCARRVFLVSQPFEYEACVYN